ncbi:hypothetical protein C2G38_2207824 [Gigaspora rosea]|uniref:Uncharacterized protein n=1 Tax=Gigaspora rosea TaxID=44941 RepID=A0A397UM02_9GLOM|nr:hypothetical protein C2G38_2207824 [Gigaspora rosea]
MLFLFRGVTKIRLLMFLISQCDDTGNTSETSDTNSTDDTGDTGEIGDTREIGDRDDMLQYWTFGQFGYLDIWTMSNCPNNFD